MSWKKRNNEKEQKNDILGLAEIFSAEILYRRNFFRRNLEKSAENISAEVFPLKFCPPKILGFNVIETKSTFFTEFKNLYSFSRYSIFNIRIYKGLY